MNFLSAAIFTCDLWVWKMRPEQTSHFSRSLRWSMAVCGELGPCEGGGLGGAWCRSGDTTLITKLIHSGALLWSSLVPGESWLISHVRHRLADVPKCLLVEIGKGKKNTKSCVCVDSDSGLWLNGLIILLSSLLLHLFQCLQ